MLDSGGHRVVPAQDTVVGRAALPSSQDSNHMGAAVQSENNFLDRLTKKTQTATSPPTPLHISPGDPRLRKQSKSWNTQALGAEAASLTSADTCPVRDGLSMSGTQERLA